MENSLKNISTINQANMENTEHSIYNTKVIVGLSILCKRVFYYSGL